MVEKTKNVLHDLQTDESLCLLVRQTILELMKDDEKIKMLLSESIKQSICDILSFDSLEENEKSAQEHLIKFSNFVIDTESRTLSTLDQHTIHLTKKEFDLLVYFSKNINKVLSRESILEVVWGKRYVVLPRAVDNFVCSLNKKLRVHSKVNGCPYIKTVRSIGYCFNTVDM